ncbi:MAG: serine hydrolase [Bacteroidota bacterium]
MKLSTYLYLFSSLVLLLSCSSEDDASTITDNPPVTAAVYFPPLDTNAPWETVSMTELDWNESALQPLIDFLDETNGKSFIMLQNGKIVEETEIYLNGHNINANWYWASAGKTLTTAVSGIAQAEGLISLNNPVSDYLGVGWTSAPIEKENLITCKNLLAMNSGLDDTVGDDVSPENLQYIADAGNRWAYHNVYKKMQDVIASASNVDFEDYFESKLKNKIGMKGAWIQLQDFNVYWSDTRSMARFGLLASNKGNWDGIQIIPEAFMDESTSTSQNLNQAYGYLWWLNGKSSYRLPQSQIEFQGELIPNAPADMVCALGRNDQKIYIIPSLDLVIVRMGDAAENVNFALSSFDNELWGKINDLINE